MRRLSPEERALWTAVARTVRVAPGVAVPALASAADSEGTRAPPLRGRAKPSVAPLPTPLKKARGGLDNTLDGSWDKRLRMGQASPDFTIDLHGETLSTAHARLNRSLALAIRTEARLILLITGRPAKDNPRLPPASRGVIRASVGDWLAASPYADRIAAIRTAHPRHGGLGAMYLILRRAR
jgi:DNA-nicking Smr family endonuclease